MKNTEWIHPMTITGPPAEGTRYYQRLYINDELWREIDKGVHILIAAPRRVGKTSIMKDIVKQGRDGYICIFENIQSVKTNEQFYKRIYYIILEQLGNYTKAKALASKWLKGRGIEEISWDGGVKFKDVELNYKNELLYLIAKLPELENKIILFIDEFSEVIFRVMKKEGPESATDILHTLREIRNKETFNHCYFVLSGSVGLDHVVESIDRRTLINDLHSLNVGELSDNEAKEFILQLVDGATMIIGTNELEYIIFKMKNQIPYFLQLLIEESDRILFNKKKQELKKTDIDKAFDNIVLNEQNLNDWEDRLRPPYQSNGAFRFCIEILTHMAHFSKLDIQEIFNISIKYEEKENYMRHIKMLKHDGYIHEVTENTYKFVSPLLKSWWKKQHPKFEIEN